MADYISQIKPGGSSGTVYNLRATMKTANISIPAAGGTGWNNNTYTYSNNNIKANSVLMWSLANTADTEMIEALANAQFVDAGTTAGAASITALGTLPSIACDVVIYWMGQTE